MLRGFFERLKRTDGPVSSWCVIGGELAAPPASGGSELVIQGELRGLVRGTDRKFGRGRGALSLRDITLDRFDTGQRVLHLDLGTVSSAQFAFDPTNGPFAATLTFYVEFPAPQWGASLLLSVSGWPPLKDALQKYSRHLPTVGIRLF